MNVEVHLSSLTGATGYLLVGILLLCYFIVALKPFHWTPPRHKENAAELSEAGLRFAAPGIAYAGRFPDWTDRAVRRSEFCLDVRARSLSRSQSGPARIFTFSADTSARNVTLGQEGSDLVVRLRTPEKSLNGTPAYSVPDIFQSLEWRDVTLCVQSETLIVKVDERILLRKSLPDEPLQDWNGRFKIALGNEVTGNRPWRGEIAQATLSTEGRVIDCLDPEILSVPSRFWAGLKTRWLYPFDDAYAPTALRDIALNFVCFIPLGFVVAMLRGINCSLVAATGVCAAASLLAETAQIFFAGRYPSLVDWGTNSLGAAVGALVAGQLGCGSRLRGWRLPDVS